jgi:hypothetical protein
MYHLQLGQAVQASVQSIFLRCLWKKLWQCESFSGDTKGCLSARLYRLKNASVLWIKFCNINLTRIGSFEIFLEFRKCTLHSAFLQYSKTSLHLEKSFNPFLVVLVHFINQLFHQLLKSRHNIFVITYSKPFNQAPISKTNLCLFASRQLNPFHY